jgi:hypothetical protein
MKYSNYIYTLIASLVIGFFYNRYKRFEDVDEEKASYAMVQKYLINATPDSANEIANEIANEDLAKKSIKKPILWIHMKYDVNARWWSSFYSRNSTDLNQPYLYLTIKSIIDTCGQDFHICLIDDESFGKLMPDWTVEVSLLADPVKTKVREIALAKLLHRYGGLRVPPSFICFQSLLPLYTYNMARYSMFVAELLNKTISASQALYAANTAFLGCAKDAPLMLEYINFLEHVVSQDFVEESNILGAAGQWCQAKILKGEVGLIEAGVVGQKDAEGGSVTIDRLVQNTYVNLAGNVLGLYIPADELLNRFAYNWFARLSAKQVLESDTTIGKYLLIAR